jgi:hypothetical protein
MQRDLRRTQTMPAMYLSRKADLANTVRASHDFPRRIPRPRIRAWWPGRPKYGCRSPAGYPDRVFVPCLDRRTGVAALAHPRPASESMRRKIVQQEPLRSSLRRLPGPCIVGRDAQESALVGDWPSESCGSFQRSQPWQGVNWASNAELTGRRRVDALPARCRIGRRRLAGKVASRWRSG